MLFADDLIGFTTKNRIHGGNQAILAKASGLCQHDTAEFCRNIIRFLLKSSAPRPQPFAHSQFAQYT